MQKSYGDRIIEYREHMLSRQEPSPEQLKDRLAMFTDVFLNKFKAVFGNAATIHRDNPHAVYRSFHEQSLPELHLRVVIQNIPNALTNCVLRIHIYLKGTDFEVLYPCFHIEYFHQPQDQSIQKSHELFLDLAGMGLYHHETPELGPSFLDDFMQQASRRILIFIQNIQAGGPRLDSPCEEIRKPSWIKPTSQERRFPSHFDRVMGSEYGP